MTEQDREVFEREMHKTRPSISFHRHSDGDYALWPVQMAWIAWQVAWAYARAADAAPCLDSGGAHETAWGPDIGNEILPPTPASEE